jgi:RimJ/RimL family protein N-acetyltransferase
MTKIQVTDEIHLSEVQSSDQAACVEYLNEPEIYDRTLRIPRPYKARDFEEWFKNVQTSTQLLGMPAHFAIRPATEKMIGGIGFTGLESGKCHCSEIGYWLARPYWGRGIMTAVLRKAIELAFERLGLVKLTAHVFAGNVASARVLQKCGFLQEGFLRKHYLKDGKYLDAMAYGLVREPESK